MFLELKIFREVVENTKNEDGKNVSLWRPVMREFEEGVADSYVALDRYRHRGIN